MRIYDLIAKKRDGGTHTREELEAIVNGFVSGEVADYQMAAWMMAVYLRGMTNEETAELTDVMAHSGVMVDLSPIPGIKVDKHSTGGVGDKTTLVIAPIVAACGVKIAKMSGRGLGHTGGTIDKMESVPGTKTALSQEEFFAQVNRIGLSVIGQSETTCTLMGSLISVLNLELAPRITRHGVLVEVYGEGILILGDSGIGKSELAIELVKRGHRLVADDAVELRKVSNRQIMGTAPENIRHFIELRGIGIVNVARVYGVGAVKLSESLDLVVQLEAWDPTKNYQRTGLESEYYDILGVSIPSTSIPVSPGRNLAVVLETAAINNRQKKMGYNAAKELLIRLGLDDKMD